ncbi:hypothetical protein BCF33_0172 [Hasllibacter halocynthiae]|uniref:Uncharacterized protein n=1 Tax=Hasllibacter halocynthiae TaxID=595589 RepID=A0A2T0X6K1_9RHOB|nr:hypothetical protein BCF33_0172 [Hasllibacter halocynthiae]
MTTSIDRADAGRYAAAMAQKNKPVPIPYTPIPVTGRTGPRPGY